MNAIILCFNHDVTPFPSETSQCLGYESVMTALSVPRSDQAIKNPARGGARSLERYESIHVARNPAIHVARNKGHLLTIDKFAVILHLPQVVRRLLHASVSPGAGNGLKLVESEFGVGHGSVCVD